MSDLANANALHVAAQPQLPVHWYFDEHILEIEKEVLFKYGPGYVGHELMTPEIGDYQTLEWMGHSKMLVRNEHGVELLSNVCRHRQAIMLKGNGNATNIVCPLHRWTYDMDGQLKGAPHFPQNPCLHLNKSPLQNWNGMLFNGARDVSKDLADLGVAEDLDFSGYKLHKIEIDELKCNWKTFIEVYLEDYHVVPFHPGLGNFVNCDELKWEFGDWYSVQTVGVLNELKKAGSDIYRKWHEAVLNYRNGEAPKHGAIWLVYYPNIMVEWYPHCLVISTLIPVAVDKTINVIEFYYPEDIALFEPEYCDAEQSAYMETGVEDKEIAERMDEGRKALWLEGRNEVGPYQSPMEDGMLHFHAFLRREIEPRF
ncbi:aromatic ring-hydroxylating dioxygenase subunit alpha [Chitinivorax sp. B]|uniref:aromatic ring-hydroxylating oxygenase subunit alpha n=1 Tax=Chitinivorax sp. B TaxID=2502235 RepID=UPI0010F88191|nr:aromatic ring-hydroxylating dioxygenase subunit alpha [Chitinivorax sp. B]